VRWGLLIFDCDGVLVDTEPLQNRVFAEMLGGVGLPMSYEETVEAFVGRSMADCLADVEERLGRSLPADFEMRLQARTFAVFERELRPVPGVEAALQEIKARVCVASSGSLEKMRKTLGLAGLLARFEGRMFSASDVSRGKPQPDLFLHAARKMGARPAACAVIEDSLAGVQAGIRAGMRVYGYTGGGRGAELADAGAIVVDDMRALPGLLTDPDGTV
jgi:HAD superfamily hydrolase (TIGR01509 family)